MENAALDRDALYYPYIHITNVNWLKSTLLCFPNIRRMVPSGYTPNDSEEIREFCEVIGPRGTPLLTSVDLLSAGALEAEKKLLETLQANDTFVRSHYCRAKTCEEYGPSADQFLLHDEKIGFSPLHAYLVGTEGGDALAWHAAAPADRPTRGNGMWLATHPRLGSAILALKAIAIADEFGFDIVTDSSSVHHTVVTTTEEDIFNQLIGQPIALQRPVTDDIADDLAEIVIATNFDVSKLSPKQIADLLFDGKDLRRFKNELIPLASTLRAIKDSREREQRMKAAANEVVENWKKYKKSLPKFALDALVDAGEVKVSDVALNLILGGGAWHAAGGAGLAIFLVSYAGLRIWRKYKKESSSPYAYLNRISKEQAKSQSFLHASPLA